MKYDFDSKVNRRNTDSVKWDVAPHVLPMWIADMDFETVPAVKKALEKTVAHGIYGYATMPDEYFESISDFWFERFGYRFSPEDMVYSSGIVAAISSMVRKLTTPGEKVLLQSPVYNVFYNCILNNGRFVAENKLLYEDGEYRMDFEDLEKKLSDPQTTLMIVCNPHNPVGNVWTREELARIGDLCKKYGVTVISDEIHCCLTSPGVKYVPFASASEVCADISATCVAASKTFNLAGLQCSCVIAKNPALRYKIWRGINTDDVGEPNCFSMRATIAAYREGGEWLDQLNEYIYENKKYAVTALAKAAPKMRVKVTDATYLLWVDVSAYATTSDRFVHDLQMMTGLRVCSGSAYGDGGEGFVRINLATQRSRVKEAIRRLCIYLESRIV